MSADRDQYLQRLGIVRWELRESAATVETDVASPATAVAETASIVADPPAPARAEIANDWSSLAAQVATCNACELHASRTQVVFGSGKRDAEWMIIGEAPGVEEDQSGEPFAGAAGELLDKMLLAAGFKREDVFITNILKCRPPENRDPAAEEISACRAYLHRQIEWVAPKLILCIGRVAAQTLLESNETAGDLRGKVHHYAPTGTPLVVTWHPAYLLRKPSEKRNAWEDLKLAMRVAAGASA